MPDILNFGALPALHIYLYILSFRLIPSLTQSHTKPRTKTVREEVILAKEGISLKDNSVSYCIPRLKILMLPFNFTPTANGTSTY